MDLMEAACSFLMDHIIRLLPVNMALMRTIIVTDLKDENHRGEITTVEERFRPNRDIVMATANTFAAPFETRGTDHMLEVEGIVG
jgi:hypothetical protein